MTSLYKSHIVFILIYALWPTENSALAHRLKTTGLFHCTTKLCMTCKTEGIQYEKRVVFISNDLKVFFVAFIKLGQKNFVS